MCFCISSRPGPSLTLHKPLGPSRALARQPGLSTGTGASDPAGPRPPINNADQGGEITLITYSMGPQVQQRREAHKDPDQRGLLPHRREQEVPQHISESSRFCFCFILKVPPRPFREEVHAFLLNEASGLKCSFLFFFSRH